jgi:hypothetical protein
MRIDWKSLKKFIDDTKLNKIINYIELDTSYYVWILYEGETFSSMLEKGSVDCEVFINDYKPLAILKDDLAPDGVRFSRSMSVFIRRLYHCLFTKITTSTTETNDKSGFITSRIRNSQKQIIQDSSQATYTEVDFCLGVGVDCSLYGGSVEFFDEVNSEIVLNVVCAPDIPTEYGGSIFYLQNFVVYKKQNQVVSRSSPNAGDIITNGVPGVNVLRFQFEHEMGMRKQVQVEFQYFV